MRRINTCRVLVSWLAVALACGEFPSRAAASQANAGGSPAARISACSLFSKDVALQHTKINKQMVPVVSKMAPQEDPIGVSGSSCSYMDFTVQVMPFASTSMADQLKKTGATPVSGVGDTALFRDNKGRYAELYVHSGKHVVTVQMSVPSGQTAASIQPDTISVAKAILAKLK